MHIVKEAVPENGNNNLFQIYILEDPKCTSVDEINFMIMELYKNILGITIFSVADLQKIKINLATNNCHAMQCGALIIACIFFYDKTCYF